MKLAIQENLIPGKSFLEKVDKAEGYGFQAIEVWGMNINNRVDKIQESISSTSEYSGKLIIRGGK